MRSPLAGTADRSDRCPPSAAYEHARVDWSAYPLCSPSGGGHSADPGQKRVPGKGDNAKKGLTNRGPLQKGGQRRGHCLSTTSFLSCAVPTLARLTFCDAWARRTRDWAAAIGSAGAFAHPTIP